MKVMWLIVLLVCSQQYLMVACWGWLEDIADDLGIVDKPKPVNLVKPIRTIVVGQFGQFGEAPSTVVVADTPSLRICKPCHMRVSTGRCVWSRSACKKIAK